MNKRKPTKAWKRSLKKHSIKSKFECEMGERPLCVRVNAELDKVIRNLPDTSSWLREAIFKQAKQDNLIEVDELNQIIVKDELNQDK